MTSLLMEVLVSLNAAACGGTSTPPGPRSEASSLAPAPPEALATKSSATKVPRDYLNDGDNDSYGDADNDNNEDNDNDNSEDHKPDENVYYHDGDDNSLVSSGHPATTDDRRAIVALVGRYRAVASASDGAKACSMIVASLAKAVVRDFGQGSAGPPYLKAGTTCPTVIALLFEHFHTRLTAPTKITGVRVNGNHAIALLGSKTAPASAITFQRENDTWMVNGLIEEPLP